jgi:hypothetical protein
VRIETSAAAGHPGTAPPRRRRDIAGLPPAAWIAVGLGVLLAIVLAVAVALK